MNKPVYLSLSILELIKIIMYDFWYDYAMPKYGEKLKLYYMDKDSFIVYIITNDTYKDIAEDIEKKIWHFKLWIREIVTEREKCIFLIKDESGGK